MNSVLLLSLVFSFVTVLLSRASIDVSFDNGFVARSTQSECELTGFRLSSTRTPPLSLPSTVSFSFHFTIVTPSAHFVVATPSARLPVVLSARHDMTPSTCLPVTHSTRLTFVPSARFVIVNPSFIFTDALQLRNPCSAAPQPVDRHSSATVVMPLLTRAKLRHPVSSSRFALVCMCMGFQSWASDGPFSALTPRPILIDVNLKELNQCPHTPCPLPLISNPVSSKFILQPTHQHH